MGDAEDTDSVEELGHSVSPAERLQWKRRYLDFPQPNPPRPLQGQVNDLVPHTPQRTASIAAIVMSDALNRAPLLSSMRSGSPLAFRLLEPLLRNPHEH